LLKEEKGGRGESREDSGTDVGKGEVVHLRAVSGDRVDGGREDRSGKGTKEELEKGSGEVRGVGEGGKGDGVATVVGSFEELDMCGTGRAAEDTNGFGTCGENG
jgi:hypothetical protein